MIILTIRTDKPEAEIGLYDGGKELAYHSWQAHRQLAETLHTKIQQLLVSADKKLEDVEGIVVFKGPGSFTGLRIGISVSNALGYALSIPIAAQGDQDWRHIGQQQLEAAEPQQIAVPDYGADPHVTRQKR